MSRTLWLFQISLAIIFLFAGGIKLVLPTETLGLSVPLPAVFVHFVGLCEVLGALGLILPGALRTRTELTPLAAAGLATVMVGATMFTPPDQAPLAVVPVFIGSMAAFVAYTRWRVAPLRAGSGPAVLAGTS